MKSDKRHELQKNELAEWLGEHLEAAKPHTVPITVGIVALVAAVLFAIYYFGTESTSGAGAWGRYFDALDKRDATAILEQLATEEANSPVGLWAQQSVGDHHLTAATMELFRDRDAATKSLAKAETAYKQVVASAHDPLLLNRARLGLAKVYEAQDQPAEAAKWYKMVADVEKESAVGKAAAKAALRMADSREVAMLDWFAKQKPRRPTPTSGPGAGLPGLPNDLPERPNLSLPSGTGFNLDDIGTGKSETPPPLDFPKPGETKPGETKPGEAKPEEPAKPAEPKPAEPAPAEKPATPEKPAEKPAEPKP